VQSIDHVLGETVNYSYDSLNRLLSAEETSANWGNAFSYDEWGSMNGQTWTPGYAATPGTVSRGASDVNGNLALPSVNYDVETRPYPPAPTPTGGYCDTPGYTYCYNWDYDPWGKRVSQTFFGSDTQAFIVNQYYFYGIDGKLLSTVQAMINDPGTNPLYTLSASTNLYFGGTPIVLNGALVATDRLGSVRANANGEQFAYYPYGLERTSTPDGRQKFATYFRDGQVNGTWEDYADQRYYNPYIGSFWSPDPGGMATADPKDPTSWNRYAYAGDDPVNFGDPTGRYRVDCDGDPDDFGCPGEMRGGGGGGDGDPCAGSYFEPVPNPACYAADPDPDPDPSPILCATAIPTGNEFDELAVLFGEDSWTLGYSQWAVQQEDLWMLNGMANQALAMKQPDTPNGVEKTIVAGRYLGYAQGATRLDNAIGPEAGSSECNHLLSAEETYDTFWNSDNGMVAKGYTNWVSKDQRFQPSPSDVTLAGTTFYKSLPLPKPRRIGY
jgi:RHS repeat-associated protein